MYKVCKNCMNMHFAYIPPYTNNIVLPRRGNDFSDCLVFVNFDLKELLKSFAIRILIKQFSEAKDVNNLLRFTSRTLVLSLKNNYYSHLGP